MEPERQAHHTQADRLCQAKARYRRGDLCQRGFPDGCRHPGRIEGLDRQDENGGQDPDRTAEAGCGQNQERIRHIQQP